MSKTQISADNLVAQLLAVSARERVCILDSCGVGHLGSHLLIAGIGPVDTFEIKGESANATLDRLDNYLSDTKFASIFSISYDFGLKLEGIRKREKEIASGPEPDVFISRFDCLIVYDYLTGEMEFKGNQSKFAELRELILVAEPLKNDPRIGATSISSNFSKSRYLSEIENIKEYIREGETYQTNLTQQFRAVLPKDLSPHSIFWRIRNKHPAPFAAFLTRTSDHVVSISPERFARISNGRISTSPIKGTRPRGPSPAEDLYLRKELVESSKDRAENTMIVDLLRNDIGRICEFGSVVVEKHCEVEEHPTLFHLVSTVSGNIRNDVKFSDIVKAIFPCGSITGCPKIRTMELIDQMETVDRGLSMGAIGYCDFENTIDLSVAIRTMVVKDGEAVFNVGGGIVIDSDPESEYEETLTKASALLQALKTEFPTPPRDQ